MAEHPSRTIIKMFQSAEDSGIYPRLILLCGKEDFLIDWSKDYIEKCLINPSSKALDYSCFSEEEIEVSNIIAACDTMPLLSKQKLVIVDNTDIFTQSPKDMGADDVASLVSYLPNIPETTTLVFTCSKPNKTKAIYKAVSKVGIVYDFIPLDDATLGGWIAKRFIQAGKQGNKSDFVTFAKLCGYGDEERNYTLFNLENDLKKAFSMFDKEYLTLDDLMEAASGQAEQNAFKLLDSAFSGNKAAAFSILNSTIDVSLPSKEMGIILSFLGLLISQIEIMVEGCERREAGQRDNDIVKAMGVNAYRYNKAMESCRGKNSKQLKKILDDAFQIEKDLKSGNINGRIALELFIGKL